MYAYSEIKIPYDNWIDENRHYAWREYEDDWSAINKLHFEELKTLREISEELDVPTWIILDLFEAKGVDKLSYPELSKRKRALNFELIYRLHFKDDLSLKEIYRQYGFSPPYSKLVLKDKGFSHRKFVNQNQ